jgi:feruloyl-CoA hydratase/lyase
MSDGGHDVSTEQGDGLPGGDLVRVELDEDGIAWVSFNRPEKRNAMSPALNVEMLTVLDDLEVDERVKVLVLTGEGTAWTAGMDLKEYFRETEGKPQWVQQRARRQVTDWQYRRLFHFMKPTIAMVNGYCFGGAFIPLVACDLAIASEDATFGLSEINWGVVPGNLVTKAVADVMPGRDAMFFLLTGEPFDGRKAAEVRLVNEAVPAARLRERTAELARRIAGHNQWIARGIKQSLRHGKDMPWEVAEDYYYAKHDQAALYEQEARSTGISGFIDDKSFRPGLEQQA